LTRLVLPVGILIEVHMRGINGAAISWVAVYAMWFPVSTLLILVPLVAGTSMLVVNWSCEGTRAP
jgi:hypothetical protein